MDTKLVRTDPENTWTWDPGDGDLDDLTPDELRPYPVRWSRPGVQLAARVALWGAVAFGCVSGLVALTRSPTALPPAPASDGGPNGLPAPVAGTAERAVAAWLTAAGDDRQDVLADVFVEPVGVASLREEALAIGDVTTIAGREVADGFWWVTVAVDVTETPPAAPGDGTAAPDPAAEEPVTTAWYVEVGVVGDVESGLAALTTPAVLPVAPAPPDGWRVPSGTPLQPDDDQYVTVEGFLRALLVGDGDPSRYMTPGSSVELPDAPVFVEVDITEVTVTEEPAEGRARVRVVADVATAGGVERRVAYAIEVAQREGRWEVVDLPGNPVVVRRADGEGAPATSTTSVPPRPDGADAEDGTTPPPSDGDTLAPDDEPVGDADGVGTDGPTAPTERPSG